MTRPVQRATPGEHPITKSASVTLGSSAEVVFTIPGRPPNVANARLHWSVKMRLMRDRKGLVTVLAQQARSKARWGPAKGRRKASAVVWIAGRLRDEDNLWASLKADCDAITAAGLAVDDGPEWLKLEVVQCKTPHRSQERVVWTVRDVS